MTASGAEDELGYGSCHPGATLLGTIAPACGRDILRPCAGP